jgi:hypothetical protein
MMLVVVCMIDFAGSCVVLCCVVLCWCYEERRCSAIYVTAHQLIDSVGSRSISFTRVLPAVSTLACLHIASAVRATLLPSIEYPSSIGRSCSCCIVLALASLFLRVRLSLSSLGPYSKVRSETTRMRIACFHFRNLVAPSRSSLTCPFPPPSHV